MQPIRRSAFLMSKWFVANLYVAIGILSWEWASLIAGAIFGLHPLVLLFRQTVGTGHGLGLIVLSYFVRVPRHDEVVLPGVLLLDFDQLEPDRWPRGWCW